MLGGVVVFKSAYAASANLQNLVAALNDKTAVSKGAFLNDVVNVAAPSNANAQRLATVVDLSIDLLSLRASRLATVPDVYNQYGVRILEGGGKLGPTFYGNADQYLKALGAVSAADALLQQTPYGQNLQTSDCYNLRGQ